MRRARSAHHCAERRRAGEHARGTQPGTHQGQPRPASPRRPRQQELTITVSAPDRPGGWRDLRQRTRDTHPVVAHRQEQAVAPRADHHLKNAEHHLHITVSNGTRPATTLRRRRPVVRECAAPARPRSAPPRRSTVPSSDEPVTFSIPLADALRHHAGLGRRREQAANFNVPAFWSADTRRPTWSAARLGGHRSP